MNRCKDYGMAACDRLVEFGDKSGDFYSLQMCNSGRLERCRRIAEDEVDSRPIDCGNEISIAAALLGPKHKGILEKGGDRPPCDGTCVRDEY